jgi:hypothetical protein
MKYLPSFSRFLSIRASRSVSEPARSVDSKQKNRDQKHYLLTTKPNPKKYALVELFLEPAENFCHFGGGNAKRNKPVSHPAAPCWPSRKLSRTRIKGGCMAWLLMPPPLYEKLSVGYTSLVSVRIIAGPVYIHIYICIYI